jgi:hypothetical protein
MTDLDVLLAVAGLIVTGLVVAGMILITPRGTVDAVDDVSDPRGAEPSRAEATEPRGPAALSVTPAVPHHRGGAHRA